MGCYDNLGCSDILSGRVLVPEPPVQRLTMLTIVGWAILALIVSIIAFNSLFMLISPRAWFQLPGWIRAQGTLTEKN